MKQELTKEQKKFVKDALERRWTAWGYPPNREALAAAAKILGIKLEQA